MCTVHTVYDIKIYVEAAFQPGPSPSNTHLCWDSVLFRPFPYSAGGGIEPGGGGAGGTVLLAG